MIFSGKNCRISSQTKRFRKITLLDRVTPIQRLDALEYNIGGHSGLYLKEEGFSGKLFGGNKIRNLEYLLQNAIDLRMKTLVTFGSIESNLAQAVALYGKQLNFDVKLYLYNLSKKPQDELDQSIKRLEDFGAEVKIESFAKSMLRRVAIRNDILRGQFYKGTYVIPIGGASPLGCLGHFGLAEEIRNQILDGQLPTIDRVYVPIGSGGTVAGLIAGFKFYGMPIKVTGVYIHKGISRLRIEKLSSKILSLVCNRQILIDSKDILDLEKSYIGDGYAASTSKSLSAMQDLYYTENVLLDETYTAKTMAAYIEFAKKNRSNKVLFLQTGNTKEIDSVHTSYFEPYCDD